MEMRKIEGVLVIEGNIDNQTEVIGKEVADIVVVMERCNQNKAILQLPCGNLLFNDFIKYICRLKRKEMPCVTR